MDRAAGRQISDSGDRINVPHLSTFQQDYLTGSDGYAYAQSAVPNIKLPYFVTDRQAPPVRLPSQTSAIDSNLAHASAFSRQFAAPARMESPSGSRSSYPAQQMQAHIHGSDSADSRIIDSREDAQPLRLASDSTTATATPSSRRHSSQQTFAHNLKSSTSLTWTEEKERVLNAPYDYLFSHPGKDIRKQMIAGFNVWLKVPKQSLDVITKVVGMLHTASLLIDDVEDMSLLRRGIPVAHSIFGHAQTINSANYIYFLALQELQKLQSPIAIDIFTHELLNLHRGQGMDLYWRDTLTCPTEQDYLEMVANKTGGLFRLAIKLMQAESSTAKNCIPLVDTIGMLFQILDDYHNLSSPTYTAHKGLAEDLTEGKFSFLVIHAIAVSSKLSLNPSSSLLSSGSSNTTSSSIASSAASSSNHDRQNAGGSSTAPNATSSSSSSSSSSEESTAPPPPPPSATNASGSGNEAIGAASSRSCPSLHSNNVLINILRQKTTDVELKKWAIGYMRQMGSFSYARAWIDALREKALALISDLEEQEEQEEQEDGEGSSSSTTRASGHSLDTDSARTNAGHINGRAHGDGLGSGNDVRSSSESNSGKGKGSGESIRAIVQKMKVSDSEEIETPDKTAELALREQVKRKVDGL